MFRIEEASMKVWDRLQTFRREHETYTAYSIGCVITWALIWAILAVTATDETRIASSEFSGVVGGLAFRHDCPSRLSTPEEATVQARYGRLDIAGSRSPNGRGMPNRRRGWFDGHATALVLARSGSPGSSARAGAIAQIQQPAQARLVYGASDSGVRAHEMAASATRFHPSLLGAGLPTLRRVPRRDVAARPRDRRLARR